MVGYIIAQTVLVLDLIDICPSFCMKPHAMLLNPEQIIQIQFTHIK